jgi:glycosyltransferase involved in cell wall biosynthesis
MKPANLLNKRKFSILFLGTQMAVGGAQRVLLDQADWFHAQGHRVVVAFLYDRDGLHESWQAPRSYPVYDLGALRPGTGILRQWIDLAGGLWRLWQLLRREQPHVIETFTFDSNIPGMMLSWLAGVPLRVATHHGKVGNVSRLQEYLHLIIAKLTASVVVAVSSQVRDELVAQGLDARKVVVIPNGVHLQIPKATLKDGIAHELGIRTGTTVLLSIGRLVYQKAHNVLVEAMRTVAVQAPRTALYIAGEGQLRAELEVQLRHAQLEENVRLLGNRADVPELLALSDIFVLPSRWEGLPIALLEAMGAGLPVVATNVEGVDEVVQDGVQGLLVSPDDAAALADALLQLIVDEPLRKRMGELGRTRIQVHYTTNIMCEKYLKMMSDGLGLPEAVSSLREPGASK